jgi:hypothetical protein
LAHGIVLAIAWGIFAPLGIGASICRDIITEKLGQSWLNFHFYLNIMAVFLTLLGFSLAVIAMQLDCRRHFQEVHHKIGLSITILLVAQGLAGYFRPPAAGNSHAHTPKGGSVKIMHYDQSTADDFDTSNPVSQESFEINAGKPDMQEGADSNKKTMKRWLWEIGHRVTGMTLLGLAWFNCLGGIEMQIHDWSDTKNWTTIFWSTTLGISGFVLSLKASSWLLGKQQDSH